MKLPKMKIYTEEKNGRWIWRIYSTVKLIEPGVCAVLSHGSAADEETAYNRAEAKLKELKKLGDLAHICRF